MSDSEQGDHDSASGSVKPSHLSAEIIAAVKESAKEFFTPFKSYVDGKLDSVKEDNKEKYLAASQELDQLKRSAAVNFKWKGNKAQFDFNSGVLAKLEKAEVDLNDGKATKAEKGIVDAITDIKRRNKHIRLADKSEAGQL